MTNAWLKPKLKVSELWSDLASHDGTDTDDDASSDGIRLTVALPKLKSVAVELDAADDVVWVDAVPAAEYHDEALNLEDVEALPDLNPPAIDLKLQGAVRILPEDITHRYDAGAGELVIDVKNVDLSEDYKETPTLIECLKFVHRFVEGHCEKYPEKIGSRLGSFRLRRSSSSSSSKNKKEHRTSFTFNRAIFSILQVDNNLCQTSKSPLYE